MASSSDSGIDWTGLLLAGGTGVANAVFGSKSKNKDRAAEAAALQKTLDAKAAADRQGVAADESKLDPFRQQMYQAGDLSSLDRLERAKYTPVTMSAAPGYEQYVPHLMGGASYEKSPELISAAAALKRNILGGNVAPTMTDPNNYGKTAALNLLQIAAQGVDPGTVSARGTGGPAPTTPAGSYGYAPPVEGTDLSDSADTGGTGSRIAKGAMTGASVGSFVPGVGTAIGAGVGALGGLIASRNNDTKGQREQFAQSIGFSNTADLWKHLYDTLPPNVAGELQQRALGRIGKHDTAANAQWMADVQAALSAPRGGFSTGASQSLTGRG
jgi:hypothetical protein